MTVPVASPRMVGPLCAIKFNPIKKTKISIRINSHSVPRAWNTLCSLKMENSQAIVTIPVCPVSSPSEFAEAISRPTSMHPSTKTYPIVRKPTLFKRVCPTVLPIGTKTIESQASTTVRRNSPARQHKVFPTIRRNGKCVLWMENISSWNRRRRLRPTLSRRPMAPRVRHCV